MNNGLKRKEVWLPKSVIDNFKAKAKEKKWSLKKYMEEILLERYQEHRRIANSTIKTPEWIKNHNKQFE